MRGLTEEHFAAFGQLVNAFAEAEVIYDKLIGDFLRLDNARAALVLAAMSWEQKCGLLTVLIAESNAPESVKRAALNRMDRIERRYKLRNLIAHCAWGKGKRKGSIAPYSFSVKRRLKMSSPRNQGPDYTAGEIREKAESVITLVQDLHHILVSRDVPAEDSPQDPGN